MLTAQDTLAALRRSLARIEDAEWSRIDKPDRFGLGLEALDSAIGGGLPRAALHEVFTAGGGDGAAAGGFGLALALRTCREQPILWVRQEMAGRELGELYAPGLAEFGADPSAFVVVRVRDAVSVLRAANEALRCAALGAVIVEAWGRHPAFDLTATRRLARRAAASGVSVFLIRLDAAPQPSAAFSRWSVRSATSMALAAGAPGAPAFEIELLRHRAGLLPRRWRVEWDRDRSVFRESPLSGAVAAVPVDRPIAPVAAAEWRRAG